MKKDQQNTDALQARFDADRIELPASLSKDAVVEKIKEHEIRQTKKKSHVLPRVVAAAAAVAVVVTSIALVPKHHAVKTTPVPTVTAAPQNTQGDAAEPSAVPAALSRFGSESAMKAYFMNQYETQKKMWFGARAGDKNADAYVEYSAAPTEAFGASTVSNGVTFNSTAKSAPASDGNFGQTNTQVRGVDEADVVKNDGRFLYIVRSEDFLIVDTQTMQEVYHADIKPKDDGKVYRFSEMYLSGDRMVLTGTQWERPKDIEDDASNDEVVYSMNRAYPYLYGESQSVVLLFDVSDKTAPKLLRTVTQDGDVVSSRMVNGVLYVATRYYVNLNDKNTLKENYAPQVDGKRIGCEDVYLRDKDEDVSTYLVLTAWNTAQPDSAVEKLSLLTEADVVYCSTDTFYVLNSVFNWDDRTDIETDSTEIYAFAFSGTTLTLRATGIVPGIVENQYCIDQFGDALRVTTTDYDYAKDVDISSLYVLNRDLKIIGKLKDIAPDEQVKSTRFMGNTAYVVTFRNTDPLFVIDLTVPEQPVIKGQVKLPGFSTYLHPITDTLLVGIGYDGSETDAIYDSVKLSLFDVSDPAQPKEVDTHVIKNASTSVERDPKAVVFDSERGILGLPFVYERWTPSGNFSDNKFIYKTVTIRDGQFADEQAYIHATNHREWFSLFRGTYIGDKVYTMTNTEVKEFDLASAELLRSVTLTEETTEPVGVPGVITYGETAVAN